LWGYTGELFERRDSVDQLISSGLIPDIQNVETDWRSEVSQHLNDASLVIPDDSFQHSGGRKGLHTEYLGHLLSEMQILARSHPEAKW
jgi:ring-1,2-phenylacetyl-CoA epoxidase subunit PaaC